MPPNIQRLPENVINQVCAGEVIERPAAVVKELVENSLDANATCVAVGFVRAGKDFISVIDDGWGMSLDDAARCLERHATSKIRCTADLIQIGTFGFRGEAIPAIASISKFALRTRRSEDELGTEIIVNDGIVHKIGKCVCKKGTHIEVTQLFKSVPARRKFLKSDQTEANHIIGTVRLFALDFPKVRFSIRHGNRIIWDVRAETSVSKRIERFWGAEILNALLPVDFSENGRRISGWVLDPQKRSGGGDMVFFVNHRVIVSKDLKNWVIGAYAKYLPYAQSVPCFLFLDIPFGQVDVNVHPTKREVRFSNGAELKVFISRAIESVLELKNALIISKSEPRLIGSNFGAPQDAPIEGRTELNGNVAATLPAIVPNQLRENPAPEGKNLFPLNGEPATAMEKKRTKLMQNFWPIGGHSPGNSVPAPEINHGAINWKFLGKIDERCVLFSTETGLIFFDVHRAAQRVAYEHVLAQQGRVDGQQLLIPLTLDLRRESFEVTEEMVDELTRVGFSFKKKAHMFYEITTLPCWMREDSGEAFLYDWLVVKRANLHGLQMEFLAKVAAGYVVSSKKWRMEHEIMQLVSDLMACEMAVLAMDGSRIYFEIPKSEIERRWKGKLAATTA
ncbi:MAG: DNA mismatch repair endonuclease MutL [Puniceicoccales bacterium]|jgi:DNA mismatch repair protein MutL|nr:DNA mismatch repair endonuclease MutL [Puniceicoccales bacterium]